jgi:hypothetical protein
LLRQFDLATAIREARIDLRSLDDNLDLAAVMMVHPKLLNQKSHYTLSTRQLHF